MKNFIIAFSLVFILNAKSYSQFPGSYPFKTVVDDHGSLYVTGDSLNPANNTYDFIVKKYINGILNWRVIINNVYGDDKGLDIAVIGDNTDRRIFATGFLKNQFNKSEILTISINANSGDTNWTRRYSLNSDSKGFGIAIDEDKNTYIAGYCSPYGVYKDIVTLKYDPYGTLQWSRIYNNRQYKQEDVGTDITVDNSHVYVMGYTFNGAQYKNDLILLNYDLNGGKQEIDIFEKRVTNETPTGFVITGKGLNNDKSKIALTSVSDNIANPSTGSSFLTIAYDGGATMDYMWMSAFSRQPGEENIATSIDADKIGDVYVTGYCYTAGNEYDFATIKYNGSNGGYAWQNEPVVYYDMGNGNDKASSIKVFGDSIYVSGSSQFFPGGYRTLAYRQNNRNIELNWDNFYIPSFLNDERNLVNRSSLLNIDTTTGNVISMMMAWDNNVINKYAVIGYSGSGNTLYTIDYGESSDNLKVVKSQETDFTTLYNNYPNPFNPSTEIRYSLSDDSFVEMKVYNMLGKEVSTIVNENQTPGYYEVKFDGSKLSSGIYYYSMSADGKVIDTKRMILLK